jgi:hypothetical protein
MRNWIIVFFLFSLAGCAPNSLEDFQREGRAEVRNLVEDCRKIHNREQLLKEEGRLKKRFESLVNLMIAARQFQEKQLDAKEIDPSFHDYPLNEDLQEELMRIYSIEGGRETIEMAQHEALIRLDAFERTLSRGSRKTHSGTRIR